MAGWCLRAMGSHAPARSMTAILLSSTLAMQVAEVGLTEKMPITHKVWLRQSIVTLVVAEQHVALQQKQCACRPPTHHVHARCAGRELVRRGTATGLALELLARRQCCGRGAGSMRCGRRGSKALQFAPHGLAATWVRALSHGLVSEPAPSGLLSSLDAETRAARSSLIVVAMMRSRRRSWARPIR